MTEETRVNIDWLRVKLMCLVIVLHYLHVWDALPVAGSTYEPVRVFGMLLESFAIVAVNVWVLLSGYLRVHSEWNSARFFELLFSVVFYGFLIYAFAYGTGFSVNNAGLFGWVQALFPVSGGAYWFMTAYLMLYLLSPVLNAGIRALSKEQLRGTLCMLLIWSSLIKSVVPVNFPPDDMGYGLQWFICLYLCGAYMRLYMPQPARKTDYKSLAGYALSALSQFLLTMCIYLYHARTGRFAYYAGVPFHYNFILNLISAVCFFRYMLSLTLPGGMFAKAGAFLAPHVTGVYLLHAHPVLFERWHEQVARISGGAPRENPMLFFLHLVVSIFIVFAAGIVADVIRGLLFWLFAGLFRKEKQT